MVARAPLVLICAASGTDLSGIADRLRGTESGNDQVDSEEDRVPVLVQDLEAELCELFKGRISSLPSGARPSMKQVVRNQPRWQLKKTWDTVFRGLLVEQEQAADSRRLRALCLHLTWYNSATSEYFSSSGLLAVTTS